MSKRELGKLASVVDVDAPRAKRRKEAAPHEEKKPEVDMDVDVTGEGKGRREQEEPEQVKEQGLKLWQTVRDAVDKECVTDLRRVRLSLFTHPFRQPCSPQWSLTFSRLSSTPKQTNVPRLLHYHKETYRSRQDQVSTRLRRVSVSIRSQERSGPVFP